MPSQITWTALCLTLLLSSGCVTWSTHEGLSVPADQLAVLNQGSGAAIHKFWVASVDDKEKGWGKVTKITFAPGRHVLGFTIHPFMGRALPSDPDEPHGALDVPRHYVEFNAAPGRIYHIQTREVPAEDGTFRFSVAIVDSESGEGRSKTMGNFYKRPN